MGIDQNWQSHFLSTVREINHQAYLIRHGTQRLAILGEKLIIHLISLNSQCDPGLSLQLQQEFADGGKMMVQLWEDVWLWKQGQVLSRIKSFLGVNKSLHGRKAQIQLLSSKQAQDFFTDHHLQGAVGAMSTFGLIYQDQIVAAASFSNLRKMVKKGDDYRSAELIRFASKNGLTVVGGLSKLIKHFFKQHEFNDLMTYADRDWSLGKGYDQLGFELTAITPPVELYVNLNNGQRYFPHRIPEVLTTAFETQKSVDLSEFLASNGFVKVFNTGNLKYHYYR